MFKLVGYSALKFSQMYASCHVMTLQTAEYGTAAREIMTANYIPTHLSPEFAHLSLKLCNI